MTTNETLINGREYFISDNVYLIIEGYDVRWFELKKMVNGSGSYRRFVMAMNTYPTNPRMFIGVLLWSTNTRSLNDPNSFDREHHEYLNFRIMNGE